MGASFAKSQVDLQKLESIVGGSGLHPWETVTAAIQSQVAQALAAQSQPKAMVCPETEATLAAAIAQAHGDRGRVLPCGAASKLDWGGLGRPVDLVVSTQRLNRLIDHAVGDLTVTVEAGMRFADLQATLAQAGQFLAIDPAYPAQATIGGLIATADTGSLRQRYNSVRDMLLGISFVRVDGQIAKAGGRVVKNVAGYDLMKLLTGSYGTLGILTQVTFRVYPLPEASQTVVLSGAVEAIAQAAQTLLSSALTPVAVDWLAPPVVQQLDLGQTIALAVRFQSIAASVSEQSQRLAEVGQALGLQVVILSISEEAALWQRLREQMTAEVAEASITCKIGITPNKAVELFQHLALLAPDGLAQIHAASGLGRLLLPTTVSPATVLKLRSLCQSHGGFLTILKAPSALKQQVDVWGYFGNALELMQKLKHQFDPHTLLSPGRFVGGL